MRCKHADTLNINLGYDFVTDMLVLEFALDRQQIEINPMRNSWLNRAGQSLAEALRLAACQELDIEFTELVTGYRVRQNQTGDFVDIYLYDTMTADCKSYSAADMNLKNTSKNKNSKQRISRSCLFAVSIKHCFRSSSFNLFKNLGTTIEDMTVGFLKFCVIPENLPMLKAYLGIENAPAEAGAQMELHHRIFKQVFDIATKNAG